MYDEPAVLDDYEGVDIERLTRELSPKNPFALNLMRITVDGEPIDDPNRSSADIQRCTDVALDHANIGFQFDNLKSSPRLSVSAWPTTVPMAELNGKMSETDEEVHTGDTSDTSDTGDTGAEHDVEQPLLPVASSTEVQATEESAEPEELMEVIPVSQALDARRNAAGGSRADGAG